MPLGHWGCRRGHRRPDVRPSAAQEPAWAGARHNVLAAPMLGRLASAFGALWPDGRSWNGQADPIRNSDDKWQLGPMELEPATRQTLRDLEERLLLPRVRASPDEVAALLADEFIEFGSSGRIYDKQQIIRLLQEEQGQALCTVVDFSARRLAADIVLVTYRVVESRTIRSSIWRLEDGRWRMVFHQGTKAENV